MISNDAQLEIALAQWRHEFLGVPQVPNADVCAELMPVSVKMEYKELRSRAFSLDGLQVHDKSQPFQPAFVVQWQHSKLTLQSNLRKGTVSVRGAPGAFSPQRVETILRYFGPPLKITGRVPGVAKASVHGDKRGPPPRRH
jgi:hypothetical protein